MSDAIQKAFDVLKTKYRQSVLNDFSVVSKAKFYIIKKEDKELMGGKKISYTCEKILPVQINPHNISRNSRRVFGGPKSLAEGAAKNENVISRDDDSDTLDLELIYDTYDEYMVRTCDGFITGVTSSFQENSFTDMSLKGEETTSLEELIKFASGEGYNSLDYSVLFKWGSLEYFGKITSLSCRYDVFSRWGEPLKANVSVTITQENGDKPITSADLGTSMAGGVIASREKMEKSFNTIALGMSTLLRS